MNNSLPVSTTSQPSTIACQCGRLLTSSNLTVASEEPIPFSNMNHADYSVKGDEDRIEGVAVDNMSSIETDSLKNQVSLKSI